MELFLETTKLPLLFFTLIANLILATVVIRDNPRGATNQVFFALGIVTALWLFFMFASNNPQIFGYNLAFARLTLFTAIFQSFGFYFFSLVMPGVHFPKIHRNFLLVLLTAIAVAILTLTPLVFKEISLDENGISHYVIGPGMFAFVLLTIFLSTWCVKTLWVKIKVSSAQAQHSIRLVFLGILLMLGLIISTIMLPIMLLDYDKFLNFAPLYVTIFLSITAYTIVRYNLFNVKLIATEAFVILLSVIFLAKISSSANISERIIDVIIFISTVLFGVLLVRSVKQEVRAREEIADLAEQLSSTNSQLEQSNERLRIIDLRKSEFVSIVSHQLRTPITALRGYASMILEESYGKLSKEMRAPVEKIFHSSSRLAEMVTDFLDVSKIEQGTMSYNLVSVDIGAMIADLGDDFIQVAKNKKLDFAVHIPKNEKFFASADDGKIRQIFSNLIDNSIKYTPAGRVDLYLSNDIERKVVTLQIKDTGIGLSQDDIHHLFGKFTRGSGGQKQNTEGSGLGLYVAKKMLEAQKGNIWVDSVGTGKGSTFFIELHAE